MYIVRRADAFYSTKGKDITSRIEKIKDQSERHLGTGATALGGVSWLVEKFRNWEGS